MGETGYECIAVVTVKLLFHIFFKREDEQHTFAKVETCAILPERAAAVYICANVILHVYYVQLRQWPAL